MMLSPNQLKELLNIIENFHVIFIAKHVGTDILSNEDKNILKNSGIDLKSFSKMGKIEESFHFGILADALSSSKAKNLSYNDFKRYLASSKFIPLTKVERIALNNVKLQSYNDIKGLGNRISSIYSSRPEGIVPLDFAVWTALVTASFHSCSSSFGSTP